jgi:hypothetical protein
MARLPATFSILGALLGLLMLATPIASRAQSSGGGAGRSGGASTGSATTGAAGPGAQGTTGVTQGQLSPVGPAVSGTDPSGMAGAARSAPPSPPGTNSLGTAQSSGTGATTGTGRGAPAGADVTGPNRAIDEENKLIDKKVKSICRGC